MRRKTVRQSYRKLRQHGQRSYEGAKQGDPLPFTLEEYRDVVHAALSEGTCYHCQRPLTWFNWSPDHRLALRAGGTSELSNIRIICWPCNDAKRSQDERKFHIRMAKIRLANIRNRL